MERKLAQFDTIEYLTKDWFKTPSRAILQAISIPFYTPIAHDLNRQSKTYIVGHECGLQLLNGADVT